MTTLLLFFIVISSQNIFCQNTDSYLWIFSSKSCIISDTISNHDTVACLSWLDSVSYEPNILYSYKYKVRLFDNQCWLPIYYKNRSCWIKEKDISFGKRIFPGTKYDAFVQVYNENVWILYRNVAILSKNKKLVKYFPDSTFEKGQWISPTKFLFQCSNKIYLYSGNNNKIAKIDTANDFLWNNELKSIIYVNYYTFSDYNKKVCLIKLASINPDCSNKTKLFELNDNATQLGVEEDDFIVIDLKHDSCNAIKCYSFLVTTNDGDRERIFVDYKGHYLTTKKDE